MFSSLGYTELLLILATVGATFVLRKQPYRAWGVATLACSLFATLATPADLYSALVVMVLMLACLWVGSRYLAPAIR